MQIIVDTETTGLPHQKHAHPVAVAAVAIEGGVEVDSFMCIVCPPVIVVDEYRQAQRVHGYDIATVWAGRSPAEASDELRNWWMGLGRPMITAFNAPFDELMLERMGFTPKGYWSECIMKAAAQRMGRETGKVSLDAAARHYGTPGRVPGAVHHALEDARIAAALGVALGMWA